MILVSAVVLSNGYRLCPDRERDLPLLDAARDAVHNEPLSPRICGVLTGAVVSVWCSTLREEYAIRLVGARMRTA